MKKLLSILALATVLAGCNQSHTEPLDPYDRSTLSIICPTGAPALAFYRYSSYSNFETNSDPQTGILPQMIAGQKDVVVLPTNAGMQAILNKGANYQLAATITFGNFYLLSMGNDSNNQLDAEDKILLFQKGNVPDKIFHYVYGNDYDANTYYVSAVSDAAAAANAGSFVDSESGERLVPNYVLLAQPVLQTVLKNNTSYSVYANMQEKYQEKSSGLPLFQASVFIKKGVDNPGAFLHSLEVDINDALKNGEVISEALADTTELKTMYGIQPSVAAGLTKNGNGMGLGFKLAKDNKQGIENFLKLFNIEGVNEEIYFEE